jgi:stage V sporulation protein SpoVS
VGQQIRRCTRNLLLLGCALVIVVVVAACVNSRYLINFVSGAQAIGHGSLLQLTDADTLARNYVEVQGDDAYDTGMEMVQYEMHNGERTNRKVVASYHALAIGDHLLLVEVGANNHTPVFRAAGALENISAHTFEQILQPLYKHEPELRGKFLPVVLKTEDFHTPGLIGLPIGATLLLIGVWCLHLARRRRAAPETHPVWTRLSRYGPPAEVAAAIDAEVASPQAMNVGPVRLTPNWLLHACPFNLQTCALGEMVWAHKKVTKVYYNFVPAGKKFAVIVYDRQRKRTEIQLRRGEKQADQLLGALNQYAPWTILGFSAELSTTWARNPTELISAVDERRAHYQHNAAA